MEKRKILIIDDSPVCTESLKRVLSNEYEIRVEHSGFSGLDAARVFCPEVILLDINMPDLDGFEVLKRLKSIDATRGIPVIIISGQANIKSEEKGLALSAADYITKPISPSIVKLRIKNQFEIIDQKHILYDLGRYRLALRMMNLAFWDMPPITLDSINDNLKFIWSPEVRGMLGYSRESDFPNVLSSLLNCVHEQDKQLVFTAFANHFRDSTSDGHLECECRVITLDKKQKYFRILGESVYDNHRNVVSSAGTIADITNLKLMEIEVSRANDFNRLMLDANPQSCMLWDQSHKIIDCNEAAVKLFDFRDKQDFCDNFINERSMQYQSDGRDTKEKIEAILTKMFKDGGNMVVDWIYRMSDGSLMPAEVKFVQVEYNDGFLVASYSKDMRQQLDMETKILHLEAEAEKAYYDSLTGTFNRRYLDVNLERLIMDKSRSNRALSVLMVDIDYFKNYNDTYGHTDGDSCLVAVAKILTKCVRRAGDFVSRYGGEEFAIVLPDTDEIGAKVVADKLLVGVRDKKIPHETSSVADYVTVSIGAVTGIVNDEHSATDFISRADKMLYLSKESGRNRFNHDII